MLHSKPIIVITHERSGTHLLINCINYKSHGEFNTIGYTPDPRDFNLKSYKHIVYKDIMVNACIENSVSKSHHQIFFMIDYLDFLFSKYKVIYVKRNVYDVLCSYYKFLSYEHGSSFPSIEDWVFSNPTSIAEKFIIPYMPDPHVLIEPTNYVHRWLLHTNNWLKYEKNMLVLNYEDLLSNYSEQKTIIEDYINRKISNIIPDVHDKSFPNFGPVKGKIGAHKEIMSKELIDNINNYLLTI